MIDALDSGEEEISTCYRNRHTPFPQQFVVNCTDRAYGNRVKIEIRGQGKHRILELCEVRVYGQGKFSHFFSFFIISNK